MTTPEDDDGVSIRHGAKNKSTLIELLERWWNYRAPARIIAFWFLLETIVGVSLIGWFEPYCWEATQARRRKEY